MELSKSQEAAKDLALVAEANVADLIEPSALARSEDVENEECFTF